MAKALPAEHQLTDTDCLQLLSLDKEALRAALGCAATRHHLRRLLTQRAELFARAAELSGYKSHRQSCRLAQLALARLNTLTPKGRPA